MEENFNIHIDIPEDSDGFMLFKCHKCGEQFKFRPEDFAIYGMSALHCPRCNHSGESILTDEAQKLYEIKLSNAVALRLQPELAKLSDSISNLLSPIDIKTDTTLEEEYELKQPTDAVIDAMRIYTMDCCHRPVKMRFDLYQTEYYCPFCGKKH